jgi:hypothetical protein
MHEQVEVLRVFPNRVPMGCCAELPTEVLRHQDHGAQQTLSMPLAVHPSYESTYREVHKGEFERLMNLVQRPPDGNFTNTDLSWARQTRVKGRRSDPRTETTVSVAYIPWERVQNFVKGEEARSDAPCKFVCQGTPSNEQGKLAFPRLNSYSMVLRCVCNLQFEFHSACSHVTALKLRYDISYLTIPSIAFWLPQVSLPVWSK